MTTLSEAMCWLVLAILLAHEFAVLSTYCNQKSQDWKKTIQIAAVGFHPLLPKSASASCGSNDSH